MIFIVIFILSLLRHLLSTFPYPIPLYGSSWVPRLSLPNVQLWLQLDDPQDSTAVHLCAGIVGTLLNGMFAKPSYVSTLEGSQCGGFIYTSQGGRQLGTQILGKAICDIQTSFMQQIQIRYFLD